ncbi:hypothetical protein EMPG_17903 [Blastomyces silverae]|uniref:Large subunit ribosomal protein L27e n=1 Tax=Blastomyces silverae TaxID=2060906 RepID=A0A0H1B6H5_9EURO|nr:hypothetical protein EMPG_17903 [Blastomyces silverae]
MRSSNIRINHKLTISSSFRHFQVVIIQPYDAGTKAHPFPYALVAGIERYPSKVTRRMGPKKVAKRSKVKPFIKTVNYNHLMPTRYTLELEGLKGAVTNDTFKEVSQREEAKKVVKKSLEERKLHTAKSSSSETSNLRTPRLRTLIFRIYNMIGKPATSHDTDDFTLEIIGRRTTPAIVMSISSIFVASGKSNISAPEETPSDFIGGRTGKSINTGEASKRHPIPHRSHSRIAGRYYITFNLLPSIHLLGIQPMSEAVIADSVLSPRATPASQKIQTMGNARSSTFRLDNCTVATSVQRGGWFNDAPSWLDPVYHRTSSSPPQCWEEERAEDLKASHPQPQKEIKQRHGDAFHWGLPPM